MTIVSEWNALADNAKSSLREKLKIAADELKGAAPMIKNERVEGVQNTRPSELQTTYANNDCWGAINLDDFVNGPTYADNGLTSPLSTIPPCMELYTTYSSGQIRGRWFVVTGTGNSMTASTCDYATFDTVIQVFSGQCDGLMCVAQNDDDPNCSTRNRSTVTFPTTRGTNYYMLVYGYQSAGSFHLSITETLPPPTNNDSCSTAAVLGNGDIAYGSTNGRNYLDYFPSCGSASQSTTGQAWYKVTSSSSYSFVETCATEHVNFDTQVSIFSGSCGNLQCVSGADDNCGTNNKEAYAEWNSNPGTTYYAVVHGYGPGYGDFSVFFRSF